MVGGAVVVALALRESIDDGGKCDERAERARAGLHIPGKMARKVIEKFES